MASTSVEVANTARLFTNGGVQNNTMARSPLAFLAAPKNFVTTHEVIQKAHSAGQNTVENTPFQKDVEKAVGAFLSTAKTVFFANSSSCASTAQQEESTKLAINSPRVR